MLREVATKVDAKVETNVKAKVAEEAPIQVALRLHSRLEPDGQESRKEVRKLE